MARTEAEIRADADGVIEDVGRNERFYGALAGNVGNLAHGVKDLASRMECRFDQVEERFAQVDERFAQIDERFAEVDRRFDNVDRQFGLVHDSLRKLDARMERLVRYIVRDELGDAAVNADADLDADATTKPDYRR